MKRRTLSLLLAAILCLGMAVPVFAAESTVTSEDGFVYTLSNEVIGTEKVTLYDTLDTASGELTTLTINIIPEDTIITLPTNVGKPLYSFYILPTDVENMWTLDTYVEAVLDPQISFATDFIYTNEDGTVEDAGSTADDPRYVFVIQTEDEAALVAFRAGTTAVAPTIEVPSSWAVEQVNAAIAAKIVPADLQTKYTTATTRAEFCALAVSLFETVTGTEIEGRAEFNDTTDVNVLKMASLEVVNGVGEGNFAPDSKLTREQAATMLSRLAAAMEKPLTAQDPTFADNASVSSWAFDAVGQMQVTGIMGGVGENTFSPATDYTREQSILTMMRLFDIVK